MQALSRGIAWWYNWHYQPETSVADTYAELGVEYVPMVWGGSFDGAKLTQGIPAGSRTLLGFNEPNFYEQANLSATDAAARWPAVEQIADARELSLVSPAVNFCGGGCHDTDPFRYLDGFTKACAGCRVDATAFHVYVACGGDGTNRARWLINHVETYKSRFSGPLWLTEFACDNATSMEDQRLFMLDALAYLEAEPRIVRYAWFAGRADNVAHVDLLGTDGVLTPLGEAYVSFPHAEPCGL
jgi:hypothetical protein